MPSSRNVNAASVGALAVSLVVPFVVVAFVLRARSDAMLAGLGATMLIVAAIAVPTLAGAGLLARRLVRRGYRAPIVYPVVSTFALVLCAGALALVDIESAISLGGGLFWIVPMTLIPAMFAAANSRVGDERFCARCGYPFIDDPGVDRCPECGAGWLGAHATVKGRPHVNRRLVIASAAGVLLLAGLQVGSQVFSGPLMRLYPTSLLMHQAAYASVSDGDYWQALSRRTLTPEQERRLATNLLDTRLANNRWSADDELWMDGRYRAGVLPADLVERYFAEMVDTREAKFVTVDERPEGVLLRVQAPIRSNIRNTQVDVVAIEGWWVDDQYVPNLPSSGRAISTYALASDRTLSGAIDAIELRVPRAGKPVKVKFAGWIAVGPFPGVGFLATWSAPPGTPGATPSVTGATSWLRRFEVETTLEPPGSKPPASMPR